MDRFHTTSILSVCALVILAVSMSFDHVGLCLARSEEATENEPRCDFRELSGVVWWGTKRTMTIRELAACCAPVFWFSLDEPTVYDKEGKDIRVPDPLPFEENPDSPVVYYQYNRILVREDADGPAYIEDPTDENNSIIDLHNAAAINLKFIAYFHAEEGFGGHPHDVEPTEFKVFIAWSGGPWMDDYPEIKCDEVNCIVSVSQVIAEAHGIQWYFNTLDVDEYTKFPMHILSEEGKHGMCTDKNSDGYYTPGYDVNRYVNDAWCCRDIIRSGALFTGGYRTWMTKVRRPQHRVFPPLPEDSHLRERFTIDGEYASENAIYELRAFPSSELAVDDALLKHKMEEKESPG